MQKPSRIFAARDILNGVVSLDGYPLRYIVVGASPEQALSTALGGRRAANQLLDTLLTAVEFLESRGWTLVNTDQGGMQALMRAPVPTQRLGPR
ncbi:hypothetical protein [Mycobacteroides abscessus]|jgi:hypothetical protein|uniref:hypothetical protein n=1 Tax=Mycobacteroides abscessus TaxID=36809 RepID=UPI0010427BAE|nr:hypothetical protein [Mycobacteroides abscessus]